MNKFIIAGLLFGVVVIIFFFANNLTKSGISGSECLKDTDCEFLFDSCQGTSSELCAPRWGAFCISGKCELSRNINITRSEQWLDTCNEYKHRGSSETVLQNCYRNAAQAALNFPESFRICEDYFPVGLVSVEGCKTSVCGEMPSVNPESVQCYKLSRQTTSCNDGIKNGGETDVDCGGDCNPCDNLKFCYNNKDCKSNNCAEIRCVNVCPNGKIADNLPCSCYSSVIQNIAFTTYAAPQIYCCDNKTQSEKCS